MECVDMDRIDILVCDNNTIEKGFDEYAHKLSSDHKNITIHKFTNRTRGELYRAMNWAIDYAKKQKYEIIDFIQDDRQYLYKKDSHLDEIEMLFEQFANLVQINCNLIWKRKIKGIGRVNPIEVDGHKYGIVVDKRACDNGFTRLSIYDKIGRYPTDAISWGLEKNRYVGKINGEIWFGKKCYKKKMNRAIAYEGNTGMIFDCAYVRGDYRYGKYFPPPGRFYFKLLDETHIKQIKKRTKRNKFSYIENFCIPDGWVPGTYGKHGDIKIKTRLDI